MFPRATTSALRFSSSSFTPVGPQIRPTVLFLRAGNFPVRSFSAAPPTPHAKGPRKRYFDQIPIKRPLPARTLFMQDPSVKGLGLKEKHARWDTLSDAQRATFEAQAERDRQEYEAALEKYQKENPPPPKQPLNAFMLFAETRRDALRAANPGASIGEIGKILGEEYRALSPGQQEAFKAAAEKAREDYATDFARWAQKNPEAAEAIDLDRIRREEREKQKALRQAEREKLRAEREAEKEKLRLQKQKEREKLRAQREKEKEKLKAQREKERLQRQKEKEKEKLRLQKEKEKARKEKLAARA